MCRARARALPLEHIAIEPVGFTSDTHAKIMNERGYRTDYQSWRQGKPQGAAAKGEPARARRLQYRGWWWWWLRDQRPSSS